MTRPPIKLTDGMSRQKVELRPLDPKNVRMYVCGPTVYDRAHIGNARAAVVYDVLFRLLRHVYGEDHVTYVRNFTDIDDKIIARAQETGRTVEEVSDETIRWYHEDMDALGCLRPTHEPRATEYVPQMVAMIETLIGRGHAYEAEGHVLFSVSSYGEYGALSGRSVEDMIAGARVEVAPYKRDPMDFVLWKPSGEGLPGWPSPWGRGRPGWHIECSAMARDLLGGAFDIHGGGQDLRFPHHENEIAQSKCAHPDEGFASIWMHNEMLTVEGKKMSKSLGNFTTVSQLPGRQVPFEVARYVLLATHYTKPLDWTYERVQSAKATLERWHALADGSSVTPKADEFFLTALRDNLNIAGGLARLSQLADEGDIAGLLGSANMLGLLWPGQSDWFSWKHAEFADDPDVREILMLRQHLRSRREYALADAARERLSLLGVRVFDRPDGSYGIPSRALLGKNRFDRLRKLHGGDPNNEFGDFMSKSEKLGMSINMDGTGLHAYSVHQLTEEGRESAYHALRLALRDLRSEVHDWVARIESSEEVQ